MLPVYYRFDLKLKYTMTCTPSCEGVKFDSNYEGRMAPAKSLSHPAY